jgi:rSAM/selenodomain-associated transferase 1
MTADRLLVFVKAPRAGAVKTRLAAVLGTENAARLYRAIAGEEIRRTAPRGGEYARTFFVDPPDGAEDIARWLPGETLVPQKGRDLGERMANAFAAAFAEGARRVALIGSDVPTCGREHVAEALAALDDHDLALGPTHDGGYYLIALDRPRPELFQAIPWSTPAVLPATAERAGVLGLAVRMLDPLRDIDTLEDIRLEWPRLRALVAGTPLSDEIDLALGPSGR